jgi:CRP-like cAMP-binding protein
VEKGVIMSMISGDNGMAIGNALFKSNDIIGISAFNDENRTVMCRPLTDAVLRRFSCQEVEENLLSNIDVYHYMLAYNSKRFVRVMTVLESHLFKSIEERICDFEATIADIQDEGEILVSDATMAMYLGIHPVSISRARKRILAKRKGKHPEASMPGHAY